VLVVDAAIAPLVAEPRAGSEQLSQALAGHPLDPLESREPWLRVRGADGYEGWVHRGYLATLTAEERRQRYASERVSLGCTVRERAGKRRALPVRALVADDAEVECGQAASASELATRFPRSPADAARTARELFEGTPYLWGGITPWGADCSGLAQSTFALHGIRLPRDSRDQAGAGSLVAGGLSALAAGDLLFFSDRPDATITHVALALDETHIVHLALRRGGYAVEDVAHPADPYAEALVRRFRFARRMADGVQGSGLNPEP